MKSKKITSNETESLKVASLPTRPTAPEAFGGRGYNSIKMKEAFDKLPLFIVERLNLLFDDIVAVGEESLAAAIPTGIKSSHTLSMLFSDIASGELSGYLSVGERSLLAELAEIRGELEAIKRRL
jgi:hypothetical protein